MTKKSAKNLAIAVDLGGTNLRVAIVDREGKILKKIETLTARKGKSGKVVTGQIIETIKKISADFDMRKILGIGISGAGPVSLSKGAIVGAPNIAFKYIPIVEPARKSFGLPVFLINDSRAGALGEKYYGVGKKTNNLVYVTFSSGIGGGAVVDGKLLKGKDGNVAEVGHLHVETNYDLPCTCGKGRGHWEAYASGNNIPKFFKIWAKRNNLETKFPSSAREIFEAARKRDEIALRFVKELGKINGRGFSNVIAAYNPEIIVLGGAVALKNFGLIIKYAKPNIDKFLKTPKVILSSLGEDAPLLGAAAMVFENIDKKYSR